MARAILYNDLDGDSSFMRYYIRRNKEARVEGPFTVEALNEGVRSGQLSPDTMASSDLGETVGELRLWRGCDWFPLAAIRELRGTVPSLREIVPGPEPVSRLHLMFYLTTAVAACYMMETEWRWIWILLAVGSLHSAALATLRFVQQRSHGMPVA